MKVLTVNASDIHGGAARAAYRLHRALLAAGVDSKMLVQSKSTDDCTVIGPSKKHRKLLAILRPPLDNLPVHLYRSRSSALFSPAWLPFGGLVDHINLLDPDIVHLHWIAGGMVRIEEIARIRAPLVWSLHDMWAFTGGCHYNQNCGRYKLGCGHCSVLNSTKTNDLSRKTYRRKHQTFSRKTAISIVGLSRWLASEAKASSLFRDASVLNLPNPIDTKIFAPFNKHLARDLFGLPRDKKLILFGAMSATSDPRKGFDELCRALQAIEDADTVQLVVFGSNQPQIPAGFKQKAYYLGHLHDDISLRLLYCAADLLVAPSLQENLSNSIMESLSCGTPVVGFDIGGNPDLIDHQECGYLAQPYEPLDLANGIRWVLKHPNPNMLAAQARNKILAEFDAPLVAKRYLDLYSQVIGNRMLEEG